MLPHARKPLNRHTKSISSRDEESALNEDFYESNEEKKNKLSNQFNSFFTIFLSILLFGTFLVHYYTSLSSVEEKVYELIPSIPQVMPMQSYIKGKHNNFVSLNYTNNGGIHEESRDNENKYNTVKNVVSRRAQVNNYQGRETKKSVEQNINRHEYQNHHTRGTTTTTTNIKETNENNNRKRSSNHHHDSSNFQKKSESSSSSSSFPPLSQGLLSSSNSSNSLLSTTSTIIPLSDYNQAAPQCIAKDCRLLITGCGRSGTHFIGDVVAKNGIDMKHERIGAYGSISWIYGVDYNPVFKKQETWFASDADTALRSAGPLEFQFYPIVHLVRHPLSVIASLTDCFCGCGALHCGLWADIPSWEFSGHYVKYSNQKCREFSDAPSVGDNFKTCRHHNGNGRLIRSMEYWIGWNKIVTEKAHYRVQLETMDLGELLDNVGVLSPNGLDRGTFQNVPFKSKTSGKRRKVTWDDLYHASPSLTEEIIQLTKEYGYSLENEKDSMPAEILHLV